MILKARGRHHGVPSLADRIANGPSPTYLDMFRHNIGEITKANTSWAGSSCALPKGLVNRLDRHSMKKGFRDRVDRLSRAG